MINLKNELNILYKNLVELSKAFKELSNTNKNFKSYIKIK